MALRRLKNSGLTLCSLENYQAGTTAKRSGVIYNHFGAITQQPDRVVTSWVSPALDIFKPTILSGCPTFVSLGSASSSPDRRALWYVKNSGPTIFSLELEECVQTGDL
ncbi:hypothetical protein AMTR_s00049p00136720 [Amborella trichopoda]|uniref:Uncharacterized protein n=1 Tax=Amborella trichopoda TaxID=13333 RepID=W1Q015_AMBTC|nr:hypothetical protein AMTR_s00049p00136720 [Amborella trichopoda]